MVVATNSSQSSPAPMVNVAPLHASTSACTELFEILITVPSKPESETKTFVPPPKIKIGESPASSIAAMISSWVET